MTKLMQLWSQFTGFLRRRRIRDYPIIPGLIVLGFVFMAVFAPLLTPYDPNETKLGNHLIPPFWQKGGSMKHPLGTDMLGRDMLTRIMFGARTSLVVAILGITVGGSIGAIVGIVGGFRGGWLDVLLMRAVDATLAFPLIFVALLLAVSFGPSLKNIVLAISIVLWGRYARVIRGEVLSIKEQAFVGLARVAGLSDWQIMLKHIFPNVLNTLVVMLTLQVGWVILVEAMLSFLGAGVPPPTPTWGTMVARGREYLQSAWWITTLPGVAIIIIVQGFNLLGDWLREVLDPKMRQVVE
jgi:peptide/nickel transport system permease protein